MVGGGGGWGKGRLGRNFEEEAFRDRIHAVYQEAKKTSDFFLSLNARTLNRRIPKKISFDSRLRRN